MLPVYPITSSNSNFKLMIDMDPYELGIIVSKYSEYKGNVVMRTASIKNFEVMDLSNPGEHHCFEIDKAQDSLKEQFFSKYVVEILDGPSWISNPLLSH